MSSNRPPGDARQIPTAKGLARAPVLAPDRERIATVGSTVYLLDGEPDMLQALMRLFQAQGFRVRGFASAQEFFAGELPQDCACLVLDVALPDIDGLQVQERLCQSGGGLPIIFLTGHGDIPTCVRAMKAGAEDFLSKPMNPAELLHAVRAALQRARDRQAEQDELVTLQDRFASLTPREREILGHVIAGKMNKQIAGD